MVDAPPWQAYVVNVYRLGGSGPIAALVLTFVLLGSACGASQPIPAVPAADPTPTAAETLERPLDPEAPSTYRPVSRHGKKPNPTIKAGSGGLSPASAVRYSDGVWLRVDRLRRGVEQSRGPGAFPGRDHTAVTLSLHNRSDTTIDLTQVVVTATYGSPARRGITGLRGCLGSP